MILDETLTTTDILDNTLTASDLSATLTFGAGDLVDLGLATDKNKGLRLPQGITAPTNPDTIEGLAFWDSDGDRVIFIDCIECWVIGQSIKDAAMKKPTYLLPVAAVSDMQRLYEDAWNTATLY